MIRKNLLNVAISSALTMSTSMVLADLPVKANLSLTAGGSEVTSCVLGTIDPVSGNCSFGGATNTGLNITAQTGSFFDLGSVSLLEGNNGITLGIVQPAANSHPGVPNGTEVPGIDLPWLFSSNTGMHQTTAPLTIISDDGNGTVELGFSGWNVTWNGIPSIPMGGCQFGDPANNGGFSGCDVDQDGIDDNVNTGIATIKCDNDCSAGEGFKIIGTTTGTGTGTDTGYFANVPAGDPSGFGGAGYTLNLAGFITDTNLAPVATQNTLLVSMAPGTSTVIDLASNVTDPDGDGIDFGSFVITYTGTRSPSPTIIDDGFGSITYTDNVTPLTDTVTPDTFTYTVLDTLGKISATFTVEVTIVTGNIPPIANAIAVTTDKNVTIVVDVFASTSDPDDVTGADPATVVASNASNGAIDFTDPVTGDVTFTPALDVTRPTVVSFDYTILDNSGDISNVATVTVTVNDPPVATDTSINVDRNTTTNVIVPNIASDSDGTLDLTTITASNGTIAGGTTSILVASGEIVYTPPNAAFIGPDEYTYTIDDNDGATSNTGTVSVAVNNVAPLAANDSASINIETDANVVIDVLANDNDIDGSTVKSTVISTNGTNGTTSVNASTGEVTYTHDGSGFIGQDTFTYTVEDNDGAISNIAIVTVNLSSGTGVLDPSAFLVLNTGLIDPTNDKAEPPLGDGSWFSMELTPSLPTHTAITGFNHIHLGEIQSATTSEPNIDVPWTFTGPLGTHQTKSAIVILTDDSAGNVSLDFSGWNVFWNGLEFVLGFGLDNGVAVMTCAVDCAFGDTFVIDGYRATVPPGQPFENVNYRLHLEGTIAQLPPQLGGGDSSAPFDITSIAGIDANGGSVIVTPGAIANAAGSTTGTHLSTTDVGNKDPLLNDSDGEQCIGGCIDVVIGNITTDYIDLVFHLTKALPDGAIFRKLIDGRWRTFDTSQGDQLGSAPAEFDTLCQGPEGVFSSGLRAGNRCVFIRLFDGGSNDADGVKNGTIVDPSGALVAGSPNTPAGSKSGGCSITGKPVSLFERADWLLIAAFVMLLAIRRRKKENSIC